MQMVARTSSRFQRVTGKSRLQGRFCLVLVKLTSSFAVRRPCAGRRTGRLQPAAALVCCPFWVIRSCPSATRARSGPGPRAALPEFAHDRSGGRS